MIIVSAADERFVPHFATMLHSAWFHNRTAQFYLLDCGITDETKAILEAFAAKHDMRFSVEAVDTAMFADIPIHRKDLTFATFARLTLTSVFSETCEKVIFLDADCVVTGDLTQLWAIDLAHDLIAGVQDEKALQDDGGDGILRDRSVYINSGVMLVNLQAWREENFGEEVISYLRRHVLRSHEQSAINIVAAGRVRTLPETWNLMLHTLERRRIGSLQPHIIHCTGSMKPWLASDAPLGSVYRFHRGMTPFPLDRTLPTYRSRLHTIASLIALRPKYWRRLIIPPLNNRDFTIPYLEKAGRDASAINQPMNRTNLS